MVPSLLVKRLEDDDSSAWDGFVHRCLEATFFHLAGWKTVIEQGGGHRPYYLYVEANGEIQGVLPLGHVRSRLFGRALISSPFCVYGGVAANTSEARLALVNAACELAEALGVGYLELRNLRPQNWDWPSKDLYVTFRKQIHPDPERNLAEIPRKQRAMVRKGMEAGLVSQFESDVENFYRLYSESVRNLGTPVLSLAYFRLLKKVFGAAVEVLTVVGNRRALASVLSFYFRDQVLPYYGGGTGEARAVKANDFMYWELMRRACERGIRVFDYGRSKKGTGSYHFKKNWGFKPEPLPYSYYLVKATQVPDINPLNPRYQPLIKLWQRMPLSLSRVIGPMIAKNLV